MVEVCEATDHDPYGDLEYRVEWTDDDGNYKARYFKSKGVAERFALRIEVRLLDQAVRDLLAAHSEYQDRRETKTRKPRNVH